MYKLTPRQLLTLVLLTLIWGLNWPVMKLGVTGFPPLTFRTLSMLIGLPLLGAVLIALKLPFRIARRHWPQLLVLTATNMLVWHVCIILALKNLSSGRAAILGYTMPVFSALIGAWLFSARLSARGWMGVGAAAVGVGLLLWHELTALAGRPVFVLLALFAAAAWALGTQLLRRSRMEVATLTLSFWMTAITTVVMSVLAVTFERAQWRLPPAPTGWAILFNGVMIFGYAQPAWFFLARSLPPLASTLSVMLIPVLGVFSGALWLHEVLHWQDYTAVLLMMVAIASVLWPARQRRAVPA
ncbi:DMT family transporter [Caenimonas terrae]|uniref:DMT family transporter n=1 Tax=Caenimonas terrae TaxID=696074 RepID=A0ABW0N9E0_9BURK